MWDLPVHILAGMFDLLASANWQRQGDETAERPKPFPRPVAQSRVLDGEQLAKGKPRTREEIDRLLGW